MQDLIIYNQKEVIIQANGKTYQDTNENFIADYGKVVKYEAIDYNRDTKCCWLNGNAFQKYPNDVCEDILNSIDTLISNKEKREYIAPTLDELKQAKINEFKFKRDSLEVEPISYQGYRFDYNDKARDRISAAIIALDVSKGQIAWTTADNTEVMVTADDLRGVIAAVAMRSNELHVKYRQLKEQVEACTIKEEVEHIAWKQVELSASEGGND